MVKLRKPGLALFALAQVTGKRYEQRWVQDWYYNPIISGGYYYAYGLASE